MAEHVVEGAWRGEGPATIKTMVSTNPPGEKHSNDIRTNETLLWVITNHVLLTLFVIVVDAPPIVHQRSCPSTRSIIMLEMTHHLPTTENYPIVEGQDRHELDGNTLISFIKKKKQKKSDCTCF